MKYIISIKSKKAYSNHFKTMKNRKKNALFFENEQTMKKIKNANKTIKNYALKI